MAYSEFDTDLGGVDLDFEDFDTDLFGGEGLGIDVEVIGATLNVNPKIDPAPPPVKQDFTGSVGNMDVARTLTSGLNAWKPVQVDSVRVDANLQGKRDNGNQQAADAKSAIGQMRQQAQDMTRQATAGQGDDPSLGRKLAGNAIGDVGIVGAAALMDPSGMLPGIAAAASVGKDAATIGGHALKSLTGQGTLATNGKGNDLAESARKMDDNGTGYVSTSSAPADDAPVSNSVFAQLSQGPGFGKTPPGISMSDVEYADSTLPHIALNIDETPQMKEALNTLDAGVETANAASHVLETGYEATVDNLIAAQEIGNPFLMNPYEARLDEGPLAYGQA